MRKTASALFAAALLGAGGVFATTLEEDEVARRLRTDRRGPTDPDGGRGDRASRAEVGVARRPEEVRQNAQRRDRQDRRAALGRGQEPASPGLANAHSPRSKG